MIVMRMRLCELCMIAATLLAGSGCSQEKSFSDLVPCRGTVVMKGEPLKQGTVTFAPMDEKKGQLAVGKVTNGSFTMRTTAEAAGVVAGKYKVRVESYEAPAGMPSDKSGQMPSPPASLIPVKYADIATSGLEVDVTDRMGPLRFELTEQ
jgi:hypothetical protein